MRLQPEQRGEVSVVPDVSVANTALYGAAAIVIAALIAAIASGTTAAVETLRRRWEYRMKRRGERQETYQRAIDLLAEWGWRQEYDPDFDVIRDFTVPFVKAANGIRVYGSPARVAAMDEIQEALDILN